MMTDLLALRKQIKARKPRFSRQDVLKKSRLDDTWRHPKGMHSKMRHHKKGYSAYVEVGWGSPAAVEGLHKSGLRPVVIHSIGQVAVLDPKTEGAVIAAHVGNRLKVLLIDALTKKNIRILNIKDAAATATGIRQAVEARKKAAVERKKAKEAKKEEKPKARKAEKPEAQTPEEKKEAERREAEKIMTRKES
jgi:large subunit ribosomal protein L32e